MNRQPRRNNSRSAGVATMCVNLAPRTPLTAFFDEACFDYMMLRIVHFRRQFNQKIHAYCLLPTSVWLLLTTTSANSTTRFTTLLRERYTDYFAERFERSVQFWHGTPRCSPLGHDGLVLDCQKFIERLPLAGNLANHPGCYPWSSYSDIAFGSSSKWLAPHPAVLRFIAAHRYEGYRDYLAAEFPPARLDYLNSRLRNGLPLHGKRALVRAVGNGPGKSGGEQQVPPWRNA